jgi:dihydroneopterin aldolase
MMTPSNPLLTQHRRLFLKGLNADAHIGIHDFEKGKSQKLLIDVDLYVLWNDSRPTTDSLEEVVDYDFIRQVVMTRIQKGHINLQETLCDELVELFLAHPKVMAVQLSTRKTEVYPDCEAVGVEVFKTKHTS